MVVGLIRPDKGRVFLNDTDITTLPMYKRAQLGIGYLPQEASIFRKLTVEENIQAVLEMTRLSKKDQREKLETLLAEFHLQHVRKSNGDVLSGGERRRTVSCLEKPPQIRWATASTLYRFMMAAQIPTVPGRFLTSTFSKVPSGFFLNMLSLL
jgi:ABC-type lipopolysaccharide export system ATPase subunit